MPSDTIKYKICFKDLLDPIRFKRRIPKTMRKTTVSWSKVDWSIFNTLANQFVNEYFKKHPCPTNKISETYYMTNAIECDFQETAKELP